MNEQLEAILAPALHPCRHFCTVCEKNGMRYEPSRGHIPRGFGGLVASTTGQSTGLGTRSVLVAVGLKLAIFSAAGAIGSDILAIETSARNELNQPAQKLAA